MANGGKFCNFFGEIHEKIKILNLAISLDSGDCTGPDNSVQLRVEKHGLSLSTGETKYQMPFKGFVVKPQSAQSLTVVNQEEVHLRLQITSFIDQLPSSDKCDLQEDLLHGTKKDCVLNIHCKKCQSTITQTDRTFSRILDLPSENWQEYLDNWCCHGNAAVNKLKDCMNPQLRHCLVGDWYILVHPEALLAEQVETRKANTTYEVLCQRCQAVVGELNFPGDQCTTGNRDLSNSLSVKLFKYSISLTWVVEPCPRIMFRHFGEEVYMAKKFLTLTKNHLCHKFIVNSTKQDKDNKAPCFALLWVLNTDAKFITSHCYEKDLSESPGGEETFSALKILYKDYLDKNFERIKKEWYGSFPSEVITFPEEICLKLLLTLNQNAKAQAPSMRCANGLKFQPLRLGLELTEFERVSEDDEVAKKAKFRRRPCIKGKFLLTESREIRRIKP